MATVAINRLSRIGWAALKILLDAMGSISFAVDDIGVPEEGLEPATFGL